MSEHESHTDDHPPHADEVWLRIKDHAGDSIEEHADRVRHAFETARTGDSFDWAGYVTDFWQQVASDTTKAVKNTFDLWSAYGSRDEG